eukprot:6054722-Amphidinium_carterae.1
MARLTRLNATTDAEAPNGSTAGKTSDVAEGDHAPPIQHILETALTRKTLCKRPRGRGLSPPLKMKWHKAPMTLMPMPGHNRRRCNWRACLLGQPLRQSGLPHPLKTASHSLHRWDS